MAIWFLIVPPMRPCDALGRSSAPMPMTRVTRYASYIVHACLLRQAVAAAEAREIAWATSTGGGRDMRVVFGWGEEQNVLDLRTAPLPS